MNNREPGSILFTCFGNFSHINANLARQLSIHFPDAEIEVFDVRTILKKNPRLIVLNLWHLCTEYAWDFFMLQKNILKSKRYFIATSYLFQKFGLAVQNRIRRGNYACVFQTQCLFSSHNPYGIPFYLYTDHTNLNNLNYPHIKPSEYLRSKKSVALEMEAYHDAALIFVISKNIRTSLIEQYHVDPRRIQQVYIGSNTPAYVHHNEKKYNSKNIIFVGKDWKRKGGDVLLQAFSRLREVIPDASLTIVGCTPKIKSRDDHINIVGQVPVEAVSAYYHNASIFCMPTKREPFGVVFVEAMFHRLGILTNDIGATSELVENGVNGYLLDNDPEAYAAKLIQLLNDPDTCRTFGIRSHEIAQERYTWEHVGYKIAKYMRRAV